MKSNIFALALAGALASSATSPAAFESVLSDEESFTLPGAQLVQEVNGTMIFAPGAPALHCGPARFESSAAHSGIDLAVNASAAIDFVEVGPVMLADDDPQATDYGSNTGLATQSVYDPSADQLEAPAAAGAILRTEGAAVPEPAVSLLGAAAALLLLARRRILS